MASFLHRFFRPSAVPNLWRKLRAYTKHRIAHKRISTLESQWKEITAARDTVFAARINSRYRAHRNSSSDIALLPTHQNSTTIAQESWEALYKPRRTATLDAAIDVIIPITHNYETVLPALYELLISTNETPFRVVAILSNHPDHKLIDKLRRLQELDLFDLLVANNEETLIELTNFAMQRHDTRDVILLASNIRCCNGWIDKLRTSAQHNPATTASISPWLTTGGITGYPCTTDALSHALEDVALLDSLCQDIFGNEEPEPIAQPATSALYIRREALHSIGLLPEKQSSIANAIAAWAHIAIDRGFAHRWARGTMLGTSTGYIPSPSTPAAIEHDASYKAAAVQLDKARLKQRCKHNHLVIEGIRTLKPAHELSGILHLTADSENPSILRIGAPDARLFPHLNFTLDTSFEELTELCHSIGITTLHIRQLAGFPARMAEWVRFFSHQSGIPYTLELQDDYLICPGMLGAQKTCDPHDLEASYRSFSESYPLDTDGQPLWLWRLHSAALIESAASTEFNTEELRQLYTRYFNLH